MDIAPRRKVDPSTFWMQWFLGLGAAIGGLVVFMVGWWDPHPVVEQFASTEHRAVRQLLGVAAGACVAGFIWFLGHAVCQIHRLTTEHNAHHRSERTGQETG